MPRQADEMTTQEAATVLERTNDYVRKLANAGRLAARREGEGYRSTLYVKKDSVVALRAEWDRQLPKRGRPLSEHPKWPRRLRATKKQD